MTTMSDTSKKQHDHFVTIRKTMAQWLFDAGELDEDGAPDLVPLALTFGKDGRRMAMGFGFADEKDKREALAVIGAVFATDSQATAVSVSLPVRVFTEGQDGYASAVSVQTIEMDVIGEAAYFSREQTLIYLEMNDGALSMKELTADNDPFSWEGDLIQRTIERMAGDLRATPPPSFFKLGPSPMMPLVQAVDIALARCDMEIMVDPAVQMEVSMSMISHHGMDEYRRAREQFAGLRALTSDTGTTGGES